MTTIASCHSVTDNDVFILAAARTPIGSFRGTLASLNAVALGTHAVNSAFEKCAGLQISPSDVDVVYFGNVVSAGCGQNVARQVALASGIPAERAPSTTINKVCASGMKAFALAAQSIRLGEAHVALAGGTESMSNAPHIARGLRSCAANAYHASQSPFGPYSLYDSLQVDGLTDAREGFSMGIAAEDTVRRLGITRAEQDAHAVSSYERAQEAYRHGHVAAEISPIFLVPGSNSPVDKDEEVAKFRREKIPLLKPAFSPDGSVTAASSSPLSDGAAAIILVSGRKLRDMFQAANATSFSKIPAVFQVISNADAEQSPIMFTTSPTPAIQLAIARAGNISITDIDFFELNEAFSCVAIANARALGISDAKINIYGGAVALGHPLGCSGARILCTLCNVLENQKAKLGCAGICNGGGGASACVIKRYATTELANILIQSNM